MAAETVEIHVTAKDLTKKAIAGVQSSLNSIQKHWKAISVAAAAALTAQIVIIKKSSDAFKVQQDAVLNLEAALGLTGKALEETSAQLQAQASALQLTTRFGDEATLAAQTYLKTLGVSTEMLPLATQATLDMAAALRMDLTSAARNVGKTVGGFAGELGEVIPELKNLSVESLRAGKGIEFLAERFAGRAAADAATYGGRLEQLSNAVGDLWEKVGEGLGTSEQFLDTIADLTAKMQSPETIAAVEAYAGAIVQVSNAMIDAIGWAGRFIDGLKPLESKSLVGLQSDLTDVNEKLRLTKAEVDRLTDSPSLFESVLGIDQVKLLQLNAAVSILEGERDAIINQILDRTAATGLENNQLELSDALVRNRLKTEKELTAEQKTRLKAAQDLNRDLERQIQMIGVDEEDAARMAAVFSFQDAVKAAEGNAELIKQAQRSLELEMTRITKEESEKRKTLDKQRADAIRDLQDEIRIRSARIQDIQREAQSTDWGPFDIFFGFPEESFESAEARMAEFVRRVEEDKRLVEEGIIPEVREDEIREAIGLEALEEQLYQRQEQIRQFKDYAGALMGDFFRDLRNDAVSTGEAFGNLFQRIAEEIENRIITMAIDELIDVLLKAAQSSKIGQVLGGIFGSGSAQAPAGGTPAQQQAQQGPAVQNVSQVTALNVQNAAAATLSAYTGSMLADVVSTFNSDMVNTAHLFVRSAFFGRIKADVIQLDAEFVDVREAGQDFSWSENTWGDMGGGEAQHGGITTREGLIKVHPQEAIIPLDQANGGFGNTNISITIVNEAGGGVRANAAADRQRDEELARVLSHLVVEEIRKQKEPGGELYASRRSF